MSWNLAITKEQFKEIYGTTINIKLFSKEPEDDNDLIHNYLVSKLWRLNNLYFIINKQGDKVSFKMNYAQHLVYAASLQHPRLIILKSRQQGISTFWLISFLDDGLTLDNLSIGMMAQGKKEAGTLLKRVELAWDEFPQSIANFLTVKRIKDNAEEQGWSNNSYVYISTSFRSATLQRLHISEFGKIANKYPERAQETKTGTLQAIAPGNNVVIESTAEGDNDFKVMWNNAILAENRVKRLGLPVFAGEDFKPVFLSWVNDPDCKSSQFEEANLTQEKYFTEIEAKLDVKLTQEQKNFWIAKYRTLGDSIYQEYPATPEEAFTKVNDGSYYGALYHSTIVKKGRIIPNLYDPMLDVYVTMDLGMNDTFTLGYYQRYQNEWRLINEYTNSGEGLAHYAEHMFNSGYDITNVYAPHDISVQELGTGKSRLAVLQECGVTNIIVLEKLGLQAGIEQVRKMIPNLWIDEKCSYSQECLQNYSKEWDEKNKTWKSQPNHNKYSHGADMLRYMAVSNPSSITKQQKKRNRRASRGVCDGMAL